MGQAGWKLRSGFVDAPTVETYLKDGVVLLRGLFKPWVAPLRAGIEKNMAAPGTDSRRYKAADSDAVFFSDYCNWQRIPEYKQFVFDSPAAAVVADLTGSREVRLFHEHVLVKEPGAATPTPWHHDQPYYCVDGRQTCSLWLALDAVPRETCIEYVAGSHRWGRWFRPERFNKMPLNADDGLEPVPDIDADRDAYEIRGWSVEPGDAIAFNFLTLHGAPGNTSATRRRRAFSTRWVGDDARFAQRSGTTSPPFPEVRLIPGDPLEHPSFPLVYRASAANA